LLADVEAGKVDVIVVCKVDRLSRSLLDFAKRMERFTAADTHRSLKLLWFRCKPAGHPRARDARRRRWS